MAQRVGRACLGVNPLTSCLPLHAIFSLRSKVRTSTGRIAATAGRPIRPPTFCTLEQGHLSASPRSAMSLRWCFVWLLASSAPAFAQTNERQMVEGFDAVEFHHNANQK